MRRAGAEVSVIGLGTWQLGADWGEVSEKDARAVLDAAVESGVTMFDTADVYGDGRSETIIGRPRCPRRLGMSGRIFGAASTSTQRCSTSRRRG